MSLVTTMMQTAAAAAAACRGEKLMTKFQGYFSPNHPCHVGFCCFDFRA
jgi:hypothetical protein